MKSLVKVAVVAAALALSSGKTSACCGYAAFGYLPYCMGCGYYGAYGYGGYPGYGYYPGYPYAAAAYAYSPAPAYAYYPTVPYPATFAYYPAAYYPAAYYPYYYPTVVGYYTYTPVVYEPYPPLSYYVPGYVAAVPLVPAVPAAAYPLPHPTQAPPPAGTETPKRPEGATVNPLAAPKVVPK